MRYAAAVTVLMGGESGIGLEFHMKICRTYVEMVGNFINRELFARMCFDEAAVFFELFVFDHEGAGIDAIEGDEQG